MAGSVGKLQKKRGKDLGWSQLEQLSTAFTISGRWFRLGRRWGPGKIPVSRKVRNEPKWLL